MQGSAPVNFGLRPNKSIERKIIVDCLSSLTPYFPIDSYRYIGLGSFWFSDFLLFHKRLHIQKMVSIEYADTADRAEYNRPLDCIRVCGGTTSEVLPTLNLGVEKELLWLDYTQGLDGPVLEDASITLPKLRPGDIFIVTANAEQGQLRMNDSDGTELTRLQALERLAPNLAPPSLKDVALSNNGLPATLAELLISNFRHTILESGLGYEFETLFNYLYQDNARMITVGGIILDESARARLANTNLISFDYANGATQVRIKAPALTLKEKFAIDRMLPRDEDLCRETLAENEGVFLNQAEVEAYKSFYRYYPRFSEVEY